MLHVMQNVRTGHSSMLCVDHVSIICELADLLH